MAFTGNNAFYSLMETIGILSKADFDAYIEDVLGYGNTQALNLDGFQWDSKMQLHFDYEQIQLENKVFAMATYTDKDSEAIPFGTKGFTTSRGSIPRQKARFLMDEHGWRTQLIAMAELRAIGGNVENYISELLFNNLSDMTNAHSTSMTYQRDQMVSAGKVELRDDNNPRGIRGVTFTASIPTENVTKLTGDKRWFIDMNPDGTTYKTLKGSASDPVNDIMEIIRKMRRKGFLNITIEVDEISFLEDMNHDAWRTKFGFLMNPALLQNADGHATALWMGKQLLDTQIKAQFEAFTGCTVKYRNNIASVEKHNPETRELERTQFRSFNQNVYVFYPSGNIGTIKVVAPLQPDSKGLYGLLLGGKGVMKYEYDAKTMIQDWWSELTALCVPNRSKEMYYLHIG